MNEIKKNSKKKEPKKIALKKIKKPLIGGGIIAGVAIAGIIGGFFLLQTVVNEKRNTLIISYPGLWFYDTLFDSLPGDGTIMIVQQIAEGLFDYNITENDAKIIPNLALSDIWSSDGLNLTCQLREDVKFHDGTPFNATAVKWNFDRLHNLLDNLSYPDIWYHNDGTLILNRTEIIDTYTVRFILNKPYVPFKAMLGNMQAYILSPKTTPANDFINTDTNFIGTGPFKYNSSTFLYHPIYEVYYTANTTLLANHDYWGGPPKLEKLVFKYFEDNKAEDDQKRYEEMLSGEIQSTYLWPFEPENYTSHPGLTLHYFDSGDIYIMGIRNKLINTTMRKALSYAVNYTKMLSIVTQEFEGGVIRTRSPLSKGLLYSNWEDFDVPEYNIEIARQYLKDVNWNNTAGTLTVNDNITAGNEWENLVTNGTPLAIYNYSYRITDTSAVSVSNMLFENFKQIGVKLNLIPATDWSDYSGKIGRSHFLLFGWGPDYFDPSTNINPLFSYKADGYANWGQVNDTLVQQWMEQAITETDETVRAQLYYDIQERIIEEVYPCIWGYTPRWCNVHGQNLKGINYNLFPFKTSFKDAYFET